jgi:hypothetical protein
MTAKLSQILCFASSPPSPHYARLSISLGSSGRCTCQLWISNDLGLEDLVPTGRPRSIEVPLLALQLPPLATELVHRVAPEIGYIVSPGLPSKAFLRGSHLCKVTLFLFQPDLDHTKPMLAASLNQGSEVNEFRVCTYSRPKGESEIM